jgi:hypothetical protein
VGQRNSDSDYEFKPEDVGTNAFIRLYDFESGGYAVDDVIAVEIVGSHEHEGEYSRVKVFLRNIDNVIYEREERQVYRDEADALRKQIKEREYWQQLHLADAKLAADAAERWRQRLAKLSWDAKERAVRREGRRE